MVLKQIRSRISDSQISFKSMLTEQPEQEVPSVSSKMKSALKDSKRQASQLIVSPGGCLGATVDCLGRVLLIDTGRLLALRMWKVQSPAQTILQRAKQ